MKNQILFFLLRRFAFVLFFCFSMFFCVSYTSSVKAAGPYGNCSSYMSYPSCNGSCDCMHDIAIGHPPVYALAGIRFSDLDLGNWGRRIKYCDYCTSEDCSATYVVNDHYDCTPGECPDGTLPNEHGICEEVCTPDPEFPPKLNMHWDYSACQWVFDECYGGEDGYGVSQSLSATPGAGVGSQACVSGCIFYMASSAQGVGLWKQTSTSCTAGSSITDTSDDNCVTGTNGDQLCWDEEPENCGYFNGEYVCVPPIPDNSCGSTPAGAIVCVGTSGDPDSDPAEPDTDQPIGVPDLVGVSGGSDPTGGPAPGGEGAKPWEYWNKDSGQQAGGLPGPGEPGYTGGAGGEQPITAQVNYPELEDQPSTDQALQSYYDRIANAPLVQALSGVFFDFPSGGTCPFSGCLDIAFLGECISWSWLCELYDDISGIISFAALALWYIVAARIILGN